MNATELIADALLRAESCPPDVGKAALLRISRVQTVVSPAQARGTLNAALAASHGLPKNQHLGFDELSRLAVAATAPELLSQLPPNSSEESLHYTPDRLARVLIEHGHTGYLLTYVLHDAPLADVPLDGIQYLLSNVTGDDDRLSLLRRAVEVWRANRHDSPIRLDQFQFIFRAWWKILPRAEALATLTEMIDQILITPDSGVNGQIQDAQFTSIHALELFQYLDLILELDRDRAGPLIEAHPELAEASKRYPEGMRSIHQEAEDERAKMPPRDSNAPGGFVMGGGPDDMDYGWALLRAEKTRDFSEPLKYAHSRYRQDIDVKNPNTASKAFWPSGAMYQTIFFRMARAAGEEAALKIDAVPDAELRLFAQIEFAAGLCGMPELASMTQHIPRRRPLPIRNP